MTNRATLISQYLQRGINGAESRGVLPLVTVVHVDQREREGILRRWMEGLNLHTELSALVSSI